MISFRPLTRLTARWVALDAEGVEHLTLEAINGRITATGVVTGRAGGDPFGAWYRLALDARWQVKQLAVHLTDSRWFIATSRRPGHWLDADGHRLAGFDGCIDVDLAGTPFTNTLPIRRLDWEPDQARDLDMLYLDFATLEARRDRQRYTCLAPKRFHYDGLASGFSADIAIDDHGLVTDYPGLFKRLL